MEKNAINFQIVCSYHFFSVLLQKVGRYIFRYEFVFQHERLNYLNNNLRGFISGDK